MPLRHRSDFKEALSTMHRLRQEAGEEPHVPTYSYKHKQWEEQKFIFYMVRLARFLVVFVIIQKVMKDVGQVLIEQGDPLHSIWQESLKMTEFYRS